ncbi:MAG: MBL fold metallo-hydrolase [Planctomycetes bacterium]|nr:MBL fold metallo-hydrolase [Planctomycetota bacterium]
MKRSATLEFLGSGTSTGVPVAGCSCEVCRSSDPHDKRLRASALVRHGNRCLVIDTGPEFRIQCLRTGLMRLDAVLYTHDHADHMNGLDDIRAYSFFKGRRLPVWGSAGTLAAIRRRFHYIWDAKQFGGGLPDIKLHRVNGPFSVIGLKVVPIPIKHGKMDILGYRIGDMAYMTDISALPAASLPLLENLNAMVISCVRFGHHRTHLNIAGAMRLHLRVRPKQTLLTHLSHYLSHKELIAALPTDICPIYDCMRIDIRL